MSSGRDDARVARNPRGAAGAPPPEDAAARSSSPPSRERAARAEVFAARKALRRVRLVLWVAMAHAAIALGLYLLPYGAVIAGRGRGAGTLRGMTVVLAVLGVILLLLAVAHLRVRREPLLWVVLVASFQTAYAALVLDWGGLPLFSILMALFLWSSLPNVLRYRKLLATGVLASTGTRASGREAR